MSETCQICGNSQNNRVHTAREMMFGTRDVFHYLECGHCGTLQLIDVPDLSRYYPNDYYSFSGGATALEVTLRRKIAARFIGKYLVTRKGILGKRLAEKRPVITDQFPPSLLDPVLSLTFNSRILDFGCGGGELLRKLSIFGFRNLTGADAFIEKDVRHSNGVRIFKSGLAELKPEFDLIMLHHSFEHLPDPRESLTQINRLLADNGTCLIRIPVVNYAWEKYGVNWFQLDPPRHLFLYTERSFRAIAEAAGFEVNKVLYDSNAFQFIASEQYARDISMHDERAYAGDVSRSVFTREQIDEWEAESRRLNTENRGDQACFYLKKK